MKYVGLGLGDMWVWGLRVQAALAAWKSGRRRWRTWMHSRGLVDGLVDVDMSSRCSGAPLKRGSVACGCGCMHGCLEPYNEAGLGYPSEGGAGGVQQGRGVARALI
jgi:hypothetical protein